MAVHSELTAITMGNTLSLTGELPITWGLWRLWRFYPDHTLSILRDPYWNSSAGHGRIRHVRVPRLGGLKATIICNDTGTPGIYGNMTLHQIVSASSVFCRSCIIRGGELMNGAAPLPLVGIDSQQDSVAVFRTVVVRHNQM